MVFLGLLHNRDIKVPFQNPSQVPLQPKGRITEKLHWEHGQEIRLAAEGLLNGMRAGSSEGTVKVKGGTKEEGEKGNAVGHHTVKPLFGVMCEAPSRWRGFFLVARVNGRVRSFLNLRER